MPNLEDKALSDSGARNSYATDAIREPSTGRGRYDLISPVMLERLAKHYEKGAAKYADRNWEKGIPVSRCLDSAMRHINKFCQGNNDEDHLVAAIWNLAAIVHFEHAVEAGKLPRWLLDHPRYGGQEDET